MTESFPRSIYTYRSFNLRGEYLHGRPELYIKKPFGYSWFPYELAPCPRSWAEETGDLSFWREHDKVRVSALLLVLVVLTSGPGRPLCCDGEAGCSVEGYRGLHCSSLAHCQQAVADRICLRVCFILACVFFTCHHCPSTRQASPVGSRTPTGDTSGEQSD